MFLNIMLYASTSFSTSHLKTVDSSKQGKRFHLLYIMLLRHKTQNRPRRKEGNGRLSTQENSRSTAEWWDINHEPRTYGNSSESERSCFHGGRRGRSSGNLFFKMQNQKLSRCWVEWDVEEMIKLRAKRSLSLSSLQGNIRAVKGRRQVMGRRQNTMS